MASEGEGALDVAALRKQLQDAQANIDAFTVSPEELRRGVAAAEALAFENGTSPKTSSVINCLKRRWEEFTTKHGEAYEWSGTPTIDLAVHSQTHGYSERLIRSCTGMSDSWGSLQVPCVYLLAKHIFTACGYAGWAGLRTPCRISLHSEPLAEIEPGL